MSEKRLGVETLSELQIWIEGKFELIAQMQNSAHDDLTTVRQKVHDLAGQMQIIIALNIPEKLSALEKADKKHDENIERFIKESAERRGMLTAFKALYAVGGLLIGWVSSLIFEAYKMNIGG